jgi:hypothetical protein
MNNVTGLCKDSPTGTPVSHFTYTHLVKPEDGQTEVTGAQEDDFWMCGGGVTNYHDEEEASSWNELELLGLSVHISMFTLYHIQNLDKYISAMYCI